MAASNPLQQLADQGQSVWLDYISRELLTTGELRADDRRGQRHRHDQQPHHLPEGHRRGRPTTTSRSASCSPSAIDDPDDIFLELAITDIQHAADILRPVHDRTKGADGYVSLEVPPDGRPQHRAQRHLRAGLPEAGQPAQPDGQDPGDRRRGCPAIERALTEGVNINVTLHLRARVVRQRHQRLPRRAQGAGAPRAESLDVHSVASFFVSRVDTAVDKLHRGEARGRPRATPRSRTCSARLPSPTPCSPTRSSRATSAARRSPSSPRPAPTCSVRCGPAPAPRIPSTATSSTPRRWSAPTRWTPCRRRRSRRSATTASSTGSTVNRDYAGRAPRHGAARRGRHRHGEGHRRPARRRRQVVRQLVRRADPRHRREGRRHATAATGRRGTSTSPPAPNSVVPHGRTDAPRRWRRRIWDRDADLWKPGDAAHAEVIDNRLGWLDVIDTMREELPRLIGLDQRGAAGRLPQLRAPRHGRQQPLPRGAAHLLRQRRRAARAARARHHRSRAPSRSSPTASTRAPRCSSWPRSRARRWRR